MTQPVIELTLTLTLPTDVTALKTCHLYRLLQEKAAEAGGKLEVSDWNRGARAWVRRRVRNPHVE